MWIIARASGAALAVALVLSGCMPTNTPTRPSPKPSGTPIFASEAEALAAATTAYAAYVKVSDEITADGGANPERIAPYVSASQLKRELVGFSTFSTNGYSTRGESKFENTRLEKYLHENAASNEVTIYLCSNASDIRLIDSVGTDITPAARADRQAFEVSFRTTGDLVKKLILIRNETWSNAGIC